MKILEVIDPKFAEYQRRNSELKRLRASDPLSRKVDYLKSREGDDSRYEDPVYARKGRYYDKLRPVYLKRWQDLTKQVDRLKGEVTHNKYKHLPTGMFVTYDTVPGVESPTYIDDIGQLIDHQNEILDDPASYAIDSFVGHVHGSHSAGQIGFMGASRLEDAFSNNPSEQGRLTRQQLEAAMAPIKQAIRSRFGNTIYLYRSQEPLQPGKQQRNVLSWTASQRFANFHGGDTYSKIEKTIPLDDVVWITDRANQQEFIVLNQRGTPYHIGP